MSRPARSKGAPSGLDLVVNPGHHRLVYLDAGRVEDRDQGGPERLNASWDPQMANTCISPPVSSATWEMRPSGAPAPAIGRLYVKDRRPLRGVGARLIGCRSRRACPMLVTRPGQHSVRHSRATSTPKTGRLWAPRGRFMHKPNSAICRESVGLAIAPSPVRIPVAVLHKSPANRRVFFALSLNRRRYAGFVS